MNGLASFTRGKDAKDKKDYQYRLKYNNDKIFDF